MLTYRTLLITAILLVCFGAVFWGYLEYDRHRFQKSLRLFKSEPQTSENERSQAPTAQEAAEMPELEKEPERFTEQDDTSLSEVEPPDTEKQGEVSESLLMEDAQVPDWATETPPVEVSEQHLWQDPNTRPINANELSPAEYEVYYRDQLRKEYGDLPEIDVYVKLHRRIVTEREPRTLDEQIQFDELSAFFYPSAENELVVQELKDLRARVGGDVIFLPAEDISIEE
ncbi:MAG: hypothetical protein OXD49_08025 [Candidatus Poribacteria bacterium]|nr:hypothetical protein [Candidatus Poribacteria bacterium]